MKIKIKSRAEEFELNVNSGPRLLDFLQNAEIPVNAACGGAGTCNKCRVKMESGFLSISKADEKAFSPSELAVGWRLSCQAIPKTNLSCIVPDVEDFKTKPRLVHHKIISEKKERRLVCDLGSTGVVVALGDGDGNAILEAHLLNRQVRFGADIMTRLKYAQDHGVEPLRAQVIETIKRCLKSIEESHPDDFAAAAKDGLLCSGNSALVSFLHGWDISSLAVFPFQPPETKSSSSFSSELGMKLISLPLLGGFVGGDTFAGIVHLEERMKVDEPWMLVDIGTNTEIVLNNGRGELHFSSAPAGPAFEGGNIAQGMRAEPGAVDSANFQNGKWELRTIGGDRERGICGSGLVDILSEALKADLIDRDGFVPDGKLQLAPELSLLADDVREFQLAKSATRTACELLIERAGVNPKKIYLAGTFAQHLKEASMQTIGLFPPDITLEPIGNSSLFGALLFANMSDENRSSFENKLRQRLRPVELALQNDFQDAFVKNLNF